MPVIAEHASTATTWENLCIADLLHLAPLSADGNLEPVLFTAYNETVPDIRFEPLETAVLELENPLSVLNAIFQP